MSLASTLSGPDFVTSRSATMVATMSVVTLSRLLLRFGSPMVEVAAAMFTRVVRTAVHAYLDSVRHRLAVGERDRRPGYHASRLRGAS